MRQAVSFISDLVSDSKLETVFGSNFVEHTYYTHKISQDGPVKTSAITERWKRDDPNAFLGEGTFGTVYRERCGQRLRAVKELRKSVIPGEEIEFTRELEAIAKFSHPRYSRCFVTSHGWYELEASVFIAMEYLPHGDLFRYLIEPLPEVETRVIVAQVLEGLEYMHDNRFIHRDLKLANIMVVRPSPNWHVKISDFGISKRRQEGVTTFHTMNRGTQGYAAPEVFGLLEGADGAESSGSVAVSNEYALDIWSLGVVAFRLLTKALPFPMPADLMFYTIGRKSFPENTLSQHNTSQDGINFIKTLMSPHPSNRKTTKEARLDVWVTDVCAPDRHAVTNRNTSEFHNNDEPTVYTPGHDTEDLSDEQVRERGHSHDHKPPSYLQPSVEDAPESDDGIHGRPEPRSYGFEHIAVQPQEIQEARDDHKNTDSQHMESTPTHRKPRGQHARNRLARSPSYKSPRGYSPDSDHWSVQAEQSSDELPRYSPRAYGWRPPNATPGSSTPRRIISYSKHHPFQPLGTASITTTPLTAHNLERVPGNEDMRHTREARKYRGETSSMRAGHPSG